MIDRVLDSQHSGPDRVLVLEAGRADRRYWRDLYVYRELFLILAWRDLSVRYKQTAIGVAWAVIRPLLTIAVFSFIFGRVANLPSGGSEPYVLMVTVGTLAWSLFSTILSDAATSLVVNSNLIGKVYFPRLIVPLSTIAVALADMGVTLVLLLGMMVLYGFTPDWRLLFLPVFVLITILAALGPALLMAAMNVKYRDFRYVIPFLLQLGAYVSPVGYASSVVPSNLRAIYSLNPIVGAVDGMRWCLLRGQGPIFIPGFLISLAVMAAMLWAGINYFRATERTFADLV